MLDRRRNRRTAGIPVVARRTGVTARTVTPAALAGRGARMVIAVALAGLSACSVLDIDGRESEREKLEAHRSQWQAQGVDSYEFVLRRLCFCGGGTSPATVVVRNGQRVSVTDVETGTPIPENFVQYYLTIDELFDFVADAIDRKAYQIDVTYDATFGFPTRIAIDYIENAVDEEMAFEASSFLPQR
jgi:Family of unknown function (DUF6174)